MLLNLLHTVTINGDIPRHLLTMDDAEMLKNVVLHSVATAFASMVCRIKHIVSAQIKT